MSKQIRGHCQFCGREHAVTDGRIHAHGYTVKHGWFEGVCGGQGYEPLEVSRRTTDTVVIPAIEREVAKLRELVEKLRAGKIHPLWAEEPGRNREGVKWEAAAPWRQKQALELAIYSNERWAAAGDQTARELATLADTYHGKPLLEVERAAKPAPILIGDLRRSSSGNTLRCRYTERGRVWWVRLDDGRQGWMGLAAWRALDAA